MTFSIFSGLFVPELCLPLIEFLMNDLAIGCWEPETKRSPDVHRSRHEDQTAYPLGYAVFLCALAHLT